MYDHDKWLTYEELKEILNFSHHVLRRAIEDLGIETVQCDPSDLKIKRYPANSVEAIRSHVNEKMGQA